LTGNKFSHGSAFFPALSHDDSGEKLNNIFIVYGKTSILLLTLLIRERKLFQVSGNLL
jgi:hypothetical protein